MTRCGLRSLSWNWFLAAYVALIALLLFAVPAHAAPSFSVAAVSCPEGGPCAVTVRKSAKASSYSKVQVATLDGTAKAGVDYSPVSVTLTMANSALVANVPLTIANRAGYQGNRAFTVHLKAVRNAVVAVADAAVTIVESEPAPVPTPSGMCPNGVPRLLNGDCPPGNGISMTQCPDQVYVLMNTDCPALPAVGQWVDDTIHAGGWVQVVKGQPGWPKYGMYGHCDVATGVIVPNSCTFGDIPGGYPTFDYTNTYRASVPGEYCQIYAGGGEYDAFNRPEWSVKCLYDGQTLILRQDNLKGVAPAPGYTQVYGSGAPIVPYTQTVNPPRP